MLDSRPREIVKNVNLRIGPCKEMMSPVAADEPGPAEDQNRPICGRHTHCLGDETPSRELKQRLFRVIVSLLRPNPFHQFGDALPEIDSRNVAQFARDLRNIGIAMPDIPGAIHSRNFRVNFNAQHARNV